MRRGAPPVRPDEDRGRRLIALTRMRRSFNSAVQVRTKEDAVVDQPLQEPERCGSPFLFDRVKKLGGKPGAVLLQICCADRMCWCAGNARAARCADKSNAGLSCRQPCLHGHGLRGIRADRRTLPRPDRRHRLRASRYSRRRLHVRLSARARPRGGRSATPASYS